MPSLPKDSTYTPYQGERGSKDITITLACIASCKANIDRVLNLLHLPYKFDSYSFYEDGYIHIWSLDFTVMLCLELGKGSQEFYCQAASC